MLRLALICIALTAPACAPEIGNITKADDHETWVLALDGKDSLVLRDRIHEQADTFCHQKKQYLMPTKKDYHETFYQLYFRCLSSGDPDLIKANNFDQERRYHKKLGGYGEVKY